MNFRQITDTFKKVAKQYREDTNVAVKYIREKNLSNLLRADGIKTDARDFVPLVTMMDIQGNSAEARAADICAKIDELTAAFTDKDHSKRDKYLDLMYNLADTFDPVTVDMDDEKQVGKLLQCLLMDQAIAEKRDENPEYYKNRYPNRAANAMADAKHKFILGTAPYINKSLAEIQTQLYSIASLPQMAKSVPDYMREARLDYTRARRDQIVAANGDTASLTTVEVPFLEDLIPYAEKGIEDITGYPGDISQKMEYFFELVIGENLLLTSSKDLQGFKEADMRKFTDPVYIDGIPFADFMKKNLPNVERGGSVEARVICTALLNGRHKVDFVNAYRDEKGVMQYEAKTLKPVSTSNLEQLRRQADEQYLSQFSWFRRTFFNWGPFRILPKPDKPNSSAEKSRHAGICKHLKAKMEPRIAELQEKARKDAVEKQKKAEKSAKVKEIKSNFDKSVDQWDKESVLGIMGQQVKGTYDKIGHTLFTANPNEKYNKIVGDLAKQVLYSQLLIERVGLEKGKTGTIEGILKGDGRKETIEKNISKTVEKLKQSKTMKELFCSKVTSEGILSSTKYNDLILDGGCKNFTIELLKKQKKNEKITMEHLLEKDVTKEKEGKGKSLV